MRRYLTLIGLLILTVPAGVSISGCFRNPAGNYCNGEGYGLKDTDVYTIDLEPRTTGVSLAFGQTQQIEGPTAKTCKGDAASVSKYTYGTTNNQLVDVSPTGNMCAGTWNRNSGGGIPDYTICQVPDPLPTTNGLPYSAAYVTASADSVTSNPVEVYVHAQVSSISLALSSAQQCYSQNSVAQLDSEACYSGPNGQQYELCAPPTVTHYSCKNGLAPGVTSVPECTSSIGDLSYNVGTSSVATINPETNQITANLPGTTAITANIAGTGASAGFFSTCPPRTISLTLNGATSGTVTQGVQQNLVTQVTDTNGNPITGLSLDYQSTNQVNIVAGNGGAITASYPGAASVYAICQPTACNPSPINQVGSYGTGLPVSSNPVSLTTPGTASAYMWFGAPGESQYFVPVELLTGTLGTPVRLPYVPNSMVMDENGLSLYFGSEHELMVYSTTSNSLLKQDTTVPGVVLAVSPNNQMVLINDQVRQVLYVYSSAGTVVSSIGGMATAAQWTPDAKTLYVTDSASAGAGHTDTLYVYNANTGWSTHPLPASPGTWTAGQTPRDLAITVPGVGAFESGSPTVAHTWCPQGTVGDYAHMSFYPQVDSVNVLTDVLGSSNDGQQIIGAAMTGGGVELSDIGVTIPTGACPAADSSGNLSPLTIPYTVSQKAVSVNATSLNQVVVSPASNLAFLTYDGMTTGATLPYYIPGTGGAVGTLGYIPLTGSASITAPIAGAFSPDDTLFFVSTAGDNKVHYINVQTLTDTQQISPNLPACTPISSGGTDPGCTYTGTDTVVPAKVITVKPRSTT
jgi:trimeric autotransporter adhesin